MSKEIPKDKRQEKAERSLKKRSRLVNYCIVIAWFILCGLLATFFIDFFACKMMIPMLPVIHVWQEMTSFRKRKQRFHDDVFSNRKGIARPTRILLKASLYPSSIHSVLSKGTSS